MIATRSTKAAFWASADMFALGLVLARAVGASRGFYQPPRVPAVRGGSGLPTAPCPRGSRESDLFVVRLSPPWRRCTAVSTQSTGGTSPDEVGPATQFGVAGGLG